MKNRLFLILLCSAFVISVFYANIIFNKNKIQKSTYVSTKIENNNLSPAITIKATKEGWRVYSKSVYNLFFEYPENYTLEENYASNGGWIQVILNKNEINSLTVGADFSEDKSSINIYMDYEPISSTVINGQKWNIFYYPKNKLAHGNPTTLAYVTWSNGLLFSVKFYNQETTSVFDSDFLSTFKFK